MKTVFVGGGQGCRAVLELVVQERLATLSLEILGVVDIDPSAPAMDYAREQGWATFTGLDEALDLPDLELIIELTGVDGVRDDIQQRVSDHVRVMDHNMASVFWDLDAVAQHLRDELSLKTRLESDMREDRRQLQAILDSLPDAMMVVDAEGHIRRVNQRFEAVTGRSAEEVLGFLCSETVCHNDNPAVCDDCTCPRIAAMQSEEALTVVQQQCCIGWSPGEGEDAYYEVTANPIRDEEGRSGAVITSREVTEQVLLKRETEESARRFKQIVNAAHGLITIKDPDGRYQLVNPAAARFIGRPPREILGRTAREVFGDDTAETFEMNDLTLLREQEHVSSREVFTFGDEERILASERILLTDYRDEPVGICCVSADITESKRLQRELLQSEKHAAMGKLAAGVAHEINNPLTGILTFAEDLMDDAPEGHESRDDLQVIVNETLRCRQIVRDLLDYSRQDQPVRSVTPLRPVVDKAVGLVRNQASFHDVTIEVEQEGDDLSVEVDPNQIQQVVLNLVINARDGTDGRGNIVIRIGTGLEDRTVSLAVEDDGTGIPDEQLARIFEPFYSTKGEQGHGLGLAVVRRIVEQNDGTIEVESQVGRGSVFRMIFPAGRGRASKGGPPSRGGTSHG